MKNDGWTVTGKFWLLPCGRVFDVTSSEHALLARAKMLGIPEDSMHQRIPIADLFKRLTPDEVLSALASGASPECVKYLEETFETSMILPASSVDPRVYVINNWGWIRTRKNAFYAKQWTDDTLARVLLNAEFWKKQPSANGTTWLRFLDMGGGELEGTRRSFEVKVFNRTPEE